MRRGDERRGPEEQRAQVGLPAVEPAAPTLGSPNNKTDLPFSGRENIFGRIRHGQRPAFFTNHDEEFAGLLKRRSRGCAHEKLAASETKFTDSKRSRRGQLL